MDLDRSGQRDSKLIISWLVGGHDGEYALAFMDDVKDRIANRVQLTTDSHKAYLNEAEEAFGMPTSTTPCWSRCGEPDGNAAPQECRDSTAVRTGTEKTRIEGSPDLAHVSTLNGRTSPCERIGQWMIFARR